MSATSPVSASATTSAESSTYNPGLQNLGTDGRRAVSMAINLVVPTRYTHVHNGIINRGDFDGMVDLVVALIQRLDARTVARVRDFTPE